MSNRNLEMMQASDMVTLLRVIYLLSGRS